MSGEKKKKKRLNLKEVLIMLSVIPVTIAAVIIVASVLLISGTKMTSSVQNSIVTSADEIGTAFDYVTKCNENSTKSFAEAPIVREYLRNPNNTALGKKA